MGFNFKTTRKGAGYNSLYTFHGLTFRVMAIHQAGSDLITFQDRGPPVRRVS